jgi:hypothetical protein
MSKKLLSYLLPFLVPVLLLAGCGWNTDTALGEHKEVVNKKPANNVVGGKVVPNTANAFVASVTVYTTPPQTTYIIGTDGSFAVANVSGKGKVVAGLVVGNSRQQLYSNISTLPSPAANIITTYRDDWDGETSTTITVEGTYTPVHVTPLTDIVYRPQNSATRDAVNAFLNQYFGTISIDYVAKPEPSLEVTTAASIQFPRTPP